MRQILAIIFALLLGGSVHAEISVPEDLPVETVTRVFTNVAEDFVFCSAFYQVVSECLNNTESGSGDQFEKVSLEVMQMGVLYLAASNAVTLGSAGREVETERLSETSMETVNNWYQRFRQEMLDEALTCANLSILYTEHMEPCNRYYEDQSVLVQQWIDELTKR